VPATSVMLRTFHRAGLGVPPLERQAPATFSHGRGQEFIADLSGLTVEEGSAPLASDLRSTLALAREAVLARFDPGVELSEMVPIVERKIRDGEAHGLLRVRESHPVGVALWDAGGPAGIAVRLLYLRPPTATAEEYRAFLELVERTAGPVAFAPTLPGLTSEEEAATFRSMGFAPFSRSEMRLSAHAVVPAHEAEEGVVVRPFRPADEPALAAVHAAAYRTQFDRYLFAEDADADRDAKIMVRALIEGRYGPFLPEASMVAERRGQLIGETLVLEFAERALIADVAVDPIAQGKGLGRALVVGTVRALRARGSAGIALAVTEGNRRAVRLYERLGFVRRLGPTREWYNTRQIPVGPERG
jgi:ribosomal protein S18 acetylase RimI-like enzyme